MVHQAKLKFEKTLFLEGPVNTGKTTTAAHYFKDLLLEKNDDPQHVLILVPQISLGDMYQNVLQAPDGELYPVIVTHSGFARQMLRRYWSAISDLTYPRSVPEPVFLNFETSQYYMRRFAAPLIETGVFNSLSLPRNRLIAQILDNLNKATLAGLTVDDAAERLKNAWSLDLGTSRKAMYHTVVQITRNYSEFCIERGLLDYAAQIKLFNEHLLKNSAFEAYFLQSFSYLIADNIEEMGGLAHDFIRWCVSRVNKSILIYEHEGGYRIFLGADPENANALQEICDTHLTQEIPLYGPTSEMELLTHAVEQFFKAESEDEEEAVPYNNLDEVAFNGCFQILHAPYYPDMLRQCGNAIHDLVKTKGVSPSQIAVIAPYISDSLRFVMNNILNDAGTECQIIRPSRPAIAEPSIRALIPLLALTYPEFMAAPAPDDLAASLTTLINNLDPIRASLLVQIVYHHNLSSWSEINAAMRERITEDAGQRYEYLRNWLSRVGNSQLPFDYFLSSLYSDVLSQPGYCFHDDMDAHREVHHLIQSAQKFRETVYLASKGEHSDVNRDFLDLLTNGLITARYDQKIDDEPDAVFIAPAHTYLTQNKVVDYQFWLDIGHSGWSERLEQPLTNPYVLRKGYPAQLIWSDDDEQRVEEQMLKNVTLGLLRRCRKGIFVGYCDLNEVGYEQYGPLVRVFQHLLTLEDMSQ